ncbi:hypothetical protein EJK55_0763 [Moraxella catarrhalis]|uniref:Uncharacterized protein n=1 Tax=Moraxella catarrhalis TaxID=480 RepID=A0ABY0BJK9_MORCA|nr:hypothetical protein EJK55_0763 [Moraxella catarrhalis]RUO16103.1 hypothetical protein EJK54_0927 [Moraxella catarrhalis]
MIPSFSTKINKTDSQSDVWRSHQSKNTKSLPWLAFRLIKWMDLSG